MTADEAIRVIWTWATVAIKAGEDVNPVELLEVCKQVLHHGGSGGDPN